MRFSNFLLPALAAAAPAAILEERQTVTPPAGVRILSATYSGNGCGTGTVASVLSADGSFLTLIFDSYVASLGPGIAIAQSTKSCNIRLSLTYPNGFQYSVLSADYRGYANLDAGVTGVQSSTYLFTGVAPTIGVGQSTTTATLRGPTTQDYTVSATARSGSLVLSPCGLLGNTNLGLLNVNSRISLSSTNGQAQGVMTTDSGDFKFTQVLKLQWRRCSPFTIGPIGFGKSSAAQ